MTTTERDWIEQVGKPAYESIAEMVAALDVDYDRLEELRDQEFRDDAETEEFAELESAAGDCESQDDAYQRIQDDPLSLRIFGERVDGEWTADRFELLLTTGGPAVRIMGELDNNEPTRAWLEVQDWGKSWTQYIAADGDVLLRYASQFSFE